MLARKSPRDPAQERADELAYWLHRTPAQRLEAVDDLRRQWLAMNPHVEQGLQRVCRLVERTRG